jgi:hypothetical protein
LSWRLSRCGAPSTDTPDATPGPGRGPRSPSTGAGDSDIAHYVAITGGRDFDDVEAVRRVLQLLVWVYGSDLRVIEGGASGADRIARDLCEELGITHRTYEADWDAECIDRCQPGHRRARKGGGDYCPAAGTYRNERMAGLLVKWAHQGHSTQVCAFKGGNGTRHMCEHSESLELLVDRQWVD